MPTRPSRPRPSGPIRLAFVAALQHLPPRQRAVLVLREVLRWQADEVAELLDTSVASVNSALQRARATLAERDLQDTEAPTRPFDEEESRLLEQYLEAFAEYDIDRIVALLSLDVVFDMPPLPSGCAAPATSAASCSAPAPAVVTRR